MENNFRTKKFLETSRATAINQAYKSALLQEKNGWTTTVRETSWGGVVVSKLNLSWKIWILLIGTMAIYIILILR